MYSNNNQFYDDVNKMSQLSFNNISERKDVPFENQVVMPNPTGLPWNIQGVPWAVADIPHPALVMFTAQSQPKSKLTFPFKRKSDMEEAVCRPTKQLKTDEMMAAHLNHLHISPDYTSHGKTNNEDFEAMNMNNEAIERLHNKHRMSLEDRLKHAERIVLSDVVKTFKSESILPDAILSRLEKPCMSLVLWKPPEKILSVSDKVCVKNDNMNKTNRQIRRSVLYDASEMDTDL